ncbi:MAG: hypothetical protein JWO95_2616, partial [Verrucomicrobiales bacterium]|nr:hypothetical protein [Verrucomicrobiales bacterium]
LMNNEFPMTNDENTAKAQLPDSVTFGGKSFGHSFVIRASSLVICELLLIVSTSSVWACAACAGGKTDSELAQGMNAGIFTLLAVVGLVLGGAASFGFYIVRRAARMSQLTDDQSVAQPTI